MINTLTRLFDYGRMTSTNESFQDSMMNGTNPTIPLIMAILIVFILQLLVGQWLWNSFLVPAVSVLNPLKSMWDILAISILLRLLMG
jgi:hypothetical protein